MAHKFALKKLFLGSLRASRAIKKGQLTTLALKALDPATNRNNVRPVAAATAAAASDQQRTSGQCGCLCGALRACGGAGG